MNKLTIVTYHYVRHIIRSDFPGIKGLEFENFKSQLDYLEDNYKIISTDDVKDAVIKNKSLPVNACWLTFDDGFKDHHKYVMPELVKRNLSGAFFPSSVPIKQSIVLNVHLIHHILSCCKDIKKLVNDLNILCKENGISDEQIISNTKNYKVQSKYDNSDVMYVKRILQYGLNEQLKDNIVSTLFNRYVGISVSDFSNTLYMNTEEVSDLIKSGMYVGSHGARHIWLNKVNEIDQKKEILQSLEFLEEIGSSTKNWVICYPHGGYNELTIDIVKKYGASIGLTTDYGVADLSKINPYKLPRMDTNEFPKK